MMLYIHEVAAASSPRNRLRTPTVDEDIDRGRRLRSASRIMARHYIQDIAKRREKGGEATRRTKIAIYSNGQNPDRVWILTMLPFWSLRPWHRTAAP